MRLLIALGAALLLSCGESVPEEPATDPIPVEEDACVLAGERECSDAESASQTTFCINASAHATYRCDVNSGCIEAVQSCDAQFCGGEYNRAGDFELTCVVKQPEQVVSPDSDWGGFNLQGRVAAISAIATNVTNGQSIYDSKCITCHALDGTGVVGKGNDLTASTMGKDDAIRMVLHGALDASPAMTPYGALLSDPQVAEVTAYALAFQEPK